MKMAEAKEGKIVVVSAPSGAGKTTIVKHLLTGNFNFEFSVSATSREPRGTETNGVDYFFLSAEEFRQRIAAGDFLEWQEVYPGKFYGSLRSEVDRILRKGTNILFDVDVVGGSNIKKIYGDRSLAIFIKPPSIGELESRLIKRSTDDPKVIRERVDKAVTEMEYAPLFDLVIVNDDLQQALAETKTQVRKFLGY